MIKIHLDQLEFFAYHGLFEEERMLGSEFLVDICIHYQPSQKIIRSINETIDYTVVYDLLEQRMKIPTNLLETIATEFCHQLMDTFPTIQMVEFGIKKLNPPIQKLVGSVGVSIQLKRSEL
ncbi:MAG: dihydroneopterin aldolase [Bacteroidota bacterium]